MEWWIFPPVPAKAALDEATPEFLAVHIVLSVSAVFLVLCRTQTATKLAFGTFVDTDRLQEPMRDIDAAEKFSKAKSGKSVVDQHKGERKFWDDNYPTMARDFAQDNLTFNLGQARLLGFEYYIGKIEAAEPWNLELRSQPIKIGRSVALTCIKCDAVHGYAPGIINLWHRCTACGAVYCPSCGKNTLRRPSTFSRTRVCDRIACSGETALVSRPTRHRSEPCHSLRRTSRRAIPADHDRARAGRREADVRRHRISPRRQHARRNPA
jgi:hypothetical protein